MVALSLLITCLAAALTNAADIPTSVAFSSAIPEKVLAYNIPSRGVIVDNMPC
jgi:hypothetical protein